MKKPAWHKIYQNGAQPESRPAVRVGGLENAQAQEQARRVLQKTKRQELHRRKRARLVGKLYTAALAALLALLIGGLAAVSVRQTLRVQEQRQSLAQSAASMDDLENQVATLQEQNKTLKGTGNAAASSDTASFDYQQLYSDLKVAQVPSAYADPAAKTVFLTFDDGPSAVTSQVLDVLKKHNAHATFFVTASNIAGHEDLLKRMVSEGHTIGLHTYSHQYNQLYGSVKALLADEDKAFQTIYAASGVSPTVFRFPGGSINRYTGVGYQPFIAEMLRRGFVYYDWNVTADTTSPTSSATAAEGKTENTSTETAQQLASQITAGVTDVKNPVVLLYDTADKTITPTALEQALQSLEQQGYTFAALTNTVRPVSFVYQ